MWMTSQIRRTDDKLYLRLFLLILVMKLIDSCHQFVYHPIPVDNSIKS